MPVALLSSRAVLRLFGSDTLMFLQGLVTNDVMRLPQEGVQYAMMLTPQGKFLFGFFLYWQDGAVLLDMDKARAEELRKRLLLYRLRSQVEIEHTDLQVAACWGEGAEGVMDPRTKHMGCRWVVDASAGISVDATERDYHAMRLAAGVPDEAQDLTPEKSFPLHFGLEDLHGVDFRKGCYVGQEVTARTKHLGTIRKCIYQVRSESGAPLPAFGSAIYAGDEAVGDMLSSEGTVGLALLQVAHAKADLRYDGGAVSAGLPSWVKNTPEA